MKKTKIIALLLLLICFTTKTFSQGNISVHLGAGLPVSDFASEDSENAAGAKVGLTVGVQYTYPLSESGLGLFGRIDFNYNGLKDDLKDEFEETYESLGINNADFKFPKYINIPISVGLNYTYQADHKIGVFANAGLAFNFLKVTDTEIKVNDQTTTVEFDLANNIGFRIGGGILINQKISVSIDYLGLGEHDIDGRTKAEGISEDLDDTAKLKIDLLTLSLGFKF